MARLLANFYRAKGTEQSVEQFFKAFFGQDVEVVYPNEISLLLVISCQRIVDWS